MGTTVATRSPDAGTRALPLRLDLSGDPLADLDEVAVGVAHVAAEFMTPVCGRCQELGPASAPQLVDGVDVGDADVEEAADVVGVARRLERHRRLVIGGWPADVDDDPAVRERDDRRLPFRSTSPPSTPA